MSAMGRLPVLAIKVKLSQDCAVVLRFREMSKGCPLLKITSVLL